MTYALHMDGFLFRPTQADNLVYVFESFNSTLKMLWDKLSQKLNMTDEVLVQPSLLTELPWSEVIPSFKLGHRMTEIVAVIDASLEDEEEEADDVPGETGVVMLHFTGRRWRCCKIKQHQWDHLIITGGKHTGST